MIPERPKGVDNSYRIDEKCINSYLIHRHHSKLIDLFIEMCILGYSKRSDFFAHRLNKCPSIKYPGNVDVEIAVQPGSVTKTCILQSVE